MMMKRETMMMGLFELVMFIVGTTVVAYGTFLWGYFQAECEGCKFLRSVGKLPEVHQFDKKVDIVCNACGLVGEFECAACHPVLEYSLICGVCDERIYQPRSSYYTIDPRGIVCEKCSQ